MAESKYGMGSWVPKDGRENWKTTDGLYFTDKWYAEEHQKHLDEKGGSSSGSSGSSTSAHNRAVDIYHEGLALNKRGDYDGAIAAQNRAISAFERSGDSKGAGYAYKSRGHAYTDKEDYANAIADYTKAISLLTEADQLADAYSGRGVNYDRNGELDKAIEDYTKAIKLGDNNLETTYYNRAYSYEQKGNMEQANADFKMAADYGNEAALRALADNGVEYTPTKRSKPSSSSSANTESGEAKGSFILSVIFGIVGGICFSRIGFMVENIPSLGSVPFLKFGLFIAGIFFCYRAWRSKSKARIIKMAIIAVAIFVLANMGQSAINDIFVQKAVQTVTAEKTATVTSDSLNFRDAPSTNGNVIKSLKKGDTLTVTGNTENGWTPVKHGKDTGFVSADLITIK